MALSFRSGLRGTLRLLRDGGHSSEASSTYDLPEEQFGTGTEVETTTETASGGMPYAGLILLLIIIGAIIGCIVCCKEEHGHINLPARHRDVKEFDKLCIWVSRQKSQYRQYAYGETKNERPWRITALEKLGIEWEVRSGLWEKHYKELIAYKSQHGNCMVPTRTSKEYKDLGLWVTVQREEGRKFSEGGKAMMNQERVDFLNKIGFVWNVTKFQWQEMYEKLLTFSSEEGHANVPPVYPYDQPLSNWVSRQRKEYHDFHDKNVDHERDSLGRLRSMRMTEERIELLNNIGLEW